MTGCSDTFNFRDVLLLYYGQQHVLVTYVALIHLIFEMYFYCIMVSNMFWSLMWPSLEWFLWEQEYDY